MRRHRQSERPLRSCLTKGCGAQIAGWKWLCDACFRRLPFARRRAIAEAGEARAPHLVAQLAREAADWLAARAVGGRA